MVWHYSGRTTWSQTEDNQVRAMLADGKSSGAIAKALDRRESSVNRRIEILTRKPKTTTRACMCCGCEFASDGPHHRLCGTCRQRNHSPYAP